MYLSLLAFASNLLLQLANSNGEQINFHFSIVPAEVLRGDFSRKNITASSLLSCIIFGCDDMLTLRCVGSFNQKTGACRTATLNAVPLSWTKAYIFNNSSDEDWVAFAPSRSLVSQQTPPGLWMMDHMFRGRNLGSAGSFFDSSVEGLKWSSAGPLGASSDWKYSLFDGSQKPAIINKQNDHYFIDFTKPYTLGVWIKTVDQRKNFPVIEGWSTIGDERSWYIWFFRSTRADQITVLGNAWGTRSFVNNTSKLLWRHLAVSYRGGKDISLFLNGSIWAIEYTIPAHTTNLKFAEVFNIGHRGNDRYKGSIACLIYYKSAFNAEQVRTLMHNCP